MRTWVWLGLLVWVGVFGWVEPVRAEAPPLAGEWHGAIELPGGMELRMVTRFSASGGGTIDIPPQMAFGLPLRGVSAVDGAVRFELPAGPGLAVFAGRFVAADRIEGQFTQGPVAGTFHLDRQAGGPAAGEAADGRDDPAGEEVTLESGGVTLAATLLRSERGGGQAPVVLIHPGSGPTDRDGNSTLIPGRNDSLKRLAQGLATAGVASLRVDKRGVGRSTRGVGGEVDMRFDHLVEDAAAWVRWLRATGEFGPVILVGHSEGGLVVTLAARRERVDGLVLLTALGERMADTIRRQLGANPGANLAEVEPILKELEQGRRVPDPPAALAALFRPSVQPYLVSAFRYDPATELTGLEVPVLLVFGGRDLQIGPESQGRLRAARPEARVVEIAEMNHVLKVVGSDRDENLRAYADPSFALAPGLVEALAGFIDTVAGVAAGGG